MYIPDQRKPSSNMDAPDVYTFRRQDGQWYFDLAAFPEQGLTENDLHLKEGARRFLNRLARGAQRLRLLLCTQPGRGMDQLELVEHCEAPRGGAIYLYRKCDQPEGGGLFWICDLALLVFGDLPERVYVQRLP